MQFKTKNYVLNLSQNKKIQGKKKTMKAYSSERYTLVSLCVSFTLPKTFKITTFMKKQKNLI